MGAVDAILAAAMTKDWRGKRVNQFDPARDMVGLRAWFRADDLAGSNDDRLTQWSDRSGQEQHVTQPLVSARPYLRIAGPNGRRYVNFGGSTWLARGLFANAWTEPALAQPNTFVAVARIPVTPTGATRCVIGSTDSGNRNWLTVRDVTDAYSLNAGTAGNSAGGEVTDAQWHVVVGTLGPTYGKIWVDGRLVTADAAQSHGAQTLQKLGLGATSSGTVPLVDGDIAEVMIFSGDVGDLNVQRLTTLLGDYYGIATVKPVPTLPYVDTTDANGIACRYWVPQKMGASAPLMIWAHPHSHTEQIVPGYFAYPLVHALVSAGCMVVATAMHGDQWGNATAVADLAAAHTLMNGIKTVSKVVLIGASMGALAATNAVKVGSIPNVKGVISLDGVHDLAKMHANAVYTASIRAAYGVASDGSDYATKTAGWDAMTQPASSFVSVPRWRFFSGLTDATVPKADHATPFAAKIASGVTESSVIDHKLGHLAAQGARPADVASFVSRCLV